MKANKAYSQYAMMYFFIYGAMGSVFALIGQYLINIGFDGVQIGTITASATAVGIFSAPIWGSIFHNRHGSKKIVLFLCWFAAASALLMLSLKEYMAILCGYVMLFFFQIPICPLADAMTIEAKLSFGAVRKWGAIGYACGVFVAGQLCEIVGLYMIFVCFGVFSFASGICVLLIIGTSKHIAGGLQAKGENIVYKKGMQEEESRGHGKIAELLRNKRFLALLMSGFFLMGTNIANNTYFSFLYSEQGGSFAGIGLVFLLMVGSEAPCMAWTQWFSAKFTMERMVLLAMLLSCLRFLWYGTGPSPLLLVLFSFLQGMVNGVLLVEFVHYISREVHMAWIGMAMTLYQAVSSNCSTIICQLLGGILLKEFNAQAVYIGFALMNLIGVLVYVGFGLHRVRR